MPNNLDLIFIETNIFKDNIDTLKFLNNKYSGLKIVAIINNRNDEILNHLIDVGKKYIISKQNIEIDVKLLFQCIDSDLPFYSPDL